jgi:hypothetical protein
VPRSRYSSRRRLMNIQYLAKSAARRALATCNIGVFRLSELTRLADRCGSNKGTRMSAHRYTRIYERFFQSFRGEQINLLEIGLLRVTVDGRRDKSGAEGATSATAKQAPSLQMWRTYFPEANIFGFDIDDFSGVKLDRCRIFRGDMANREDLISAVKAIGRPLDVIIDDGSHASHHQQISLGTLFPFLRSGGLYVIEDMHWQPQRLEKDNAPKTRDICRQLQVKQKFFSPFLSKEENEYIQTHLGSIHLFDSCTQEVIDPSDALAILKKIN